MPQSSSESRHPPSTSDDAVIVGKVLGAWGTRGDLKVETFTDSPQRFAPGSTLFLDGGAVRVLRARSHKGGVVVGLDLVNNRTHAESLRGAILTISRDEVGPLPEGSYYHFQVIGIGVWTEDGEFLGEVREILPTGVNDVYVVRDGGKKEVLVPSLESVVLDVDLGENRMVVRLPEGLR